MVVDDLYGDPGASLFLEDRGYLPPRLVAGEDVVLQVDGAFGAAEVFLQGVELGGAFRIDVEGVVDGQRGEGEAGGELDQ